MRGRLNRLTSKLPGLLAFCMRSIRCPGRPACGAALYSGRASGKDAVMTTATINRSAKKSLPSFEEQRAERLAATIAAYAPSVDADKAERVAVAELRLSGIEVPPTEFESAPDAVEIPAAKVRNFEAITRSEAEMIVTLLKVPLDDEDETWGEDWNSGDVRWTLTPHQLRKRKRAVLSKAIVCIKEKLTRTAK